MQKIVVRISCVHRFLLALLFVCISSLAFSLMLIVMTFEVGLLFAASIGLGTGAWIFHTFVKMPELPKGFKFSQGKRGDYMPNPDPCCSPSTLAGEDDKKDTSRELEVADQVQSN